MPEEPEAEKIIYPRTRECGCVEIDEGEVEACYAHWREIQDFWARHLEENNYRA